MYQGNGIEIKFDRDQKRICCIFKFCEFAELVKTKLICNHPNPDIVCGQDSFQCFGFKRKQQDKD